MNHTEHIVPKSVLVDFDGCIVMHNWPDVGQDVPGAVEVLRKLKSAGHTLILYTMRADHHLDGALAWAREHDLEFNYINRNPDYETGSRKIYAHFCIDDHNIGVPLKFDEELHHKPFVDWEAVEKILKEKKLL